jgi:uncharacterized protein YecE (DUF72 family)
MAELYAGTSGFAYKSWQPVFYPAKLPEKQFLEFYAQRLNCVEINYTFRRMPLRSTLENWLSMVPENFAFCVKAHMRITHVLRLRSAEEAASWFLGALSPLKEAGRLGVVLFQLPPNLKADLEVLREFLCCLPRGTRYAFEFRHASWFHEPVYELLRDRNIAFCHAESEKLEAPKVITADFVYARLRKPEYTPEEREEIWRDAQVLLEQGKTLYALFKHEETPEGAQYAEELLRRHSGS